MGEEEVVSGVKSAGYKKERLLEERQKDVGNVLEQRNTSMD